MIRVYLASDGGYVNMEKVVKSKDEWKTSLTKEQYKVLREKGTERAFATASTRRAWISSAKMRRS